MDSFYGGKLGYSFVLRPHPNHNDGYWVSEAAIDAQIATGYLKYGDYVVITNDNNEYTEQSGNLYRIVANANGQLVRAKVGNIGTVAAKSPVFWQDNLETSPEQRQNISFMSENSSRIAEVAVGSWEDVTVNDEVRTSIDLKIPQPVVDCTVESVNQMEAIGVTAYKQADVVWDKVHPYYYNMTVTLPNNVYVGSKNNRILRETYFRNGDIHLEFEDLSKDTLPAEDWVNTQRFLPTAWKSFNSEMPFYIDGNLIFLHQGIPQDDLPYYIPVLKGGENAQYDYYYFSLTEECASLLGEGKENYALSNIECQFGFKPGEGNGYYTWYGSEGPVVCPDQSELSNIIIDWCLKKYYKTETNGDIRYEEATLTSPVIVDYTGIGQTGAVINDPLIIAAESNKEVVFLLVLRGKHITGSSEEPPLMIYPQIDMNTRNTQLTLTFVQAQGGE